jgi:uroporphyrinogen-III decarboxylase
LRAGRITPDARAVRREHLRLDAADGHHLAAQRALAGHRRVGPDPRPVSSDVSAVKIVTPALGPSLGTAPAGTWMCTS